VLVSLRCVRLRLWGRGGLINFDGQTILQLLNKAADLAEIHDRVPDVITFSVCLYRSASIARRLMRMMRRRSIRWSWRPRSGVDERSGDEGLPAFAAPALWQFGFELPPQPFKVAAQLGDDGTVRQVRIVYVVRYERYSKPSAGGVLGTNEKPKTKGANCERRHPSGNGIATQTTKEPGGYRRYKPHATDQNRIVSHSALRFCTLAILPGLAE